MKIYFENLCDKLSSAVEVIKNDLGISKACGKESAKLCVSVKEAKDHILNVKLDGACAEIEYGGGIATFLRGLAQLTKWVRDGKKSSQIKETPFLHLNGAMVDMSRNAVMNVKTVKFMMRKMALMGLNCYMLYTEDTYEIEGRPYFGHLRGRYTKAELKELDAYALSIGIELIPCIQTLGHLATHLKWSCAWSYTDTANCLLAGAEETHKLIDDMLKTCKECFTTDKVHVGMDETADLGTGRYLKLNGYRSLKDIYLEHLNKVVDMCKGYGLKPMMWSDMIIEIASEHLERPAVYDTRAVITDELLALVPKEMQMVFWDYYNENESFYTKNIENHLKIDKNTMFGGGIWTWSGYGPLYSHSLRNTLPALHACLEGGISECIATIWHNGSESNLLLGLAGLAWYADYGYKCSWNEESMKECFAYATGEDYDSFAMLQDVERPDGGYYSISKTLLYNDPLLGLMDKQISKLPLDEHYKKTTEKLATLKANDEMFSLCFDVIVKLSSLLENKASFGLRAKSAYDAGDKKALELLCKECDVIIEKTVLLKDAHRKAWMTFNNPFGFEVMDIRYGGIIARMETAKERLSDYLSGKIDSIGELEAERLRADCGEGEDNLVNGGFYWRGYQGIATVNRLP